MPCLVAFMAYPALAEATNLSPTLIAPLALVTLTGTRPTRATNGLATLNCLVPAPTSNDPSLIMMAGLVETTPKTL